MSEQLVQALGMAVTVVGILVLAPAATGSFAVGWFFTTLGFLGRWIKALRPIYRVGACATVEVNTFTGVYVRPHPWQVPLLVRAQLRELRAAVDDLHSRQKALGVRLDTLDQDHQRRLKESEERLRDELATLEGKVRAIQHQAASLELTALPYAAFGTLVVGCPFWFDDSGWGGFFVGGLAVVAFIRLCRAFPGFRIGARQRRDNVGYSHHLIGRRS